MPPAPDCKAVFSSKPPLENESERRIQTIRPRELKCARHGGRVVKELKTGANATGAAARFSTLNRTRLRSEASSALCSVGGCGGWRLQDGPHFYHRNSKLGRVFLPGDRKVSNDIRPDDSVGQREVVAKRVLNESGSRGQLLFHRFADCAAVRIFAGQMSHHGLHHGAHFLHRGGAGLGHRRRDCLLDFFR